MRNRPVNFPPIASTASLFSGQVVPLPGVRYPAVDIARYLIATADNNPMTLDKLQMLLHHAEGHHRAETKRTLIADYFDTTSGSPRFTAVDARYGFYLGVVHAFTGGNPLFRLGRKAHPEKMLDADTREFLDGIVYLYGSYTADELDYKFLSHNNHWNSLKETLSMEIWNKLEWKRSTQP